MKHLRMGPRDPHRPTRMLPASATGRLGASSLLVLCLLCFALRAAATSDALAPIKQLSDRLETGDRHELAGLFVTGLQAGADELSWGVSSLPCPGRRYRLLTTEAAISSVFSSSSEMLLTITAERLPSGLRCGSSLPRDVHEGRATVFVLPRGGNAAGQRPLSVYEDSETKVSSFVECITLAETCPGRYLLRAYLNTPRRRVVLEYAFTVTVLPAPHQTVSGSQGDSALASISGEALQRWPIA